MKPPDSANRICFITPDYPASGGGLAVASQRLVTVLAAEGYEVDVVTDTYGEISPDAMAVTAREDGATVHRVARESGRAESVYRLFRFVRELDRRRDFSMFHGFFLSSAGICAEAAKGRPVIASIRGGDVNGLTLSPFFRSQFIAALKKAAWVTSVNRTYLENMGQYVDLRDRSSVIRNGVPDSLCVWRLEERIRGVVGVLGEFRQEKDIPLVIRSYHRVPPGLRRKLLLVGTFPDAREREWSETLIREFGLAPEVEFAGYLPHAEALQRFGSMHLYVHCSSREGMPNSLLEAAAAGVPIIATASAGIQEILTDQKDALLVPHGYPQQLGAAIERVLADDALAARLSQAALQLATRYSLLVERAEWLALYRRLLANQDGAAQARPAAPRDM